jgi:ACS family glucarate transporter-like MFS transporter
MKASRVRYTVVLFALTLAMLAYMQRVSISQAAPTLSADLGLDKVQMGYIFGAFALSYALLEIPMGALGDKFGMRKVLAPLVIIWSAFQALSGAAWNFTSLFVFRLLFGSGEAGCFPNLTKMLSVWLPRDERIRMQSIMWACTRWAGAVTPAIMVFVIQAAGWRGAFIFFGLLGGVWALAFLMFYKDDPATHPKVNAEELKLLEGSRVMAHEKPPGGWLKVIANRDVLLLVIQYTLFSFVWFFYITWLPTFMQETYNLTPLQTAGYAFVPLAAGGFGALISGMIPTRVPRRTIALVGFGVTAVVLFLVTKAPTPALAILMLGMASFFSDLTMPISWNACVEIGRRYTATVAGTMNMCSGLAGFALSVGAGQVVKELGWTPVLYIMTGAAVVCFTCWLMLDPDKIARRQAQLNAPA